MTKRSRSASVSVPALDHSFIPPSIRASSSTSRGNLPILEDDLGTAVSGSDMKIRTSRPSKRLRFASSSTSEINSSCVTRTTLEGALSEEILLRCLSYLVADDLARVSRVSQGWNRLARDQELWRHLYLTTFTRRHSCHTTVSSSSSRPTYTRPYRDLYKISINWSRGQARDSLLSSTMSSTVVGARDTTRQAVKRAVLDQVVLPEDLVLSQEEDIGHSLADDDVKEEESEGDTNRSVGGSGRNGLRGINEREEPDTLLQFYKNWLFTTSKSNSTTVKVHQTLPTGSSILIGEIGSERRGERITQMRLDEAIPTSSANPSSGSTILRLRLVVFYASASFTLHSITLPTTSSSPPTLFSSHIIYSSPPTSSSLSPFPSNFSPRADAVILARWNGPLLVAMTKTFVMRFWRVVELSGRGGGRVELVESDLRMRSSEKWEPVVLDLRKITSELNSSGTSFETTARDRKFDNDEEAVAGEGGSEIYKVTLAYSTPIFPSDWSVGIQEFHITLPSLFSTPSTSHRTPGRILITSRHAVAPSVRPPYFAPTTTRRRRDYREANQEAEAGEGERRRSKAVVTGIEFSWPYIITSRSDNVIDLFLLSSPIPATTSTPTSRSFDSTPTSTTRTILPPLKLEHFKSLYGHSSSVESVAIKNGGLRCVSGGRDGRVRIWSLGLDELAESRNLMMGADGRESVVDVLDRSSSTSAFDSVSPFLDDEADIDSLQTSNWSNLLKEYNLSSTMGAGAGRRIKKVWFDEEKILCLEDGDGSRVSEDGMNEEHEEGRERIRVMRFD